MSNIADSLFSGVFIFLLFFGALVGFFLFKHVMTTTGDPLQKSAEFEKFFAALDNISIFIFFAASFAAVVSAFFIRAHPIFFAISILSIFVLFMVMPTLANTYETVGNALYPQSMARFSNTAELMKMLPIWTAVGAFIAAVVGIARGES